MRAHVLIEPRRCVVDDLRLLDLRPDVRASVESAPAHRNTFRRVADTALSSTYIEGRGSRRGGAREAAISVRSTRSHTTDGIIYSLWPHITMTDDDIRWHV